MIDDKLDYFCKEVMEFMNYMSIISGGAYQVDIMNLTKLMSSFYDENTRYNKTQLVYQFLTKIGGRDMMKEYSQFKKFRENNTF
ncbi:hypothetical protein OKW24_005641 [Peribacillus simplex]|uniref:hypothetical protein n=1 Tax=Peribacillus simplex TaxID=1478 RepID=UPI0024E1C990|nr:hypothetical protein [Peribacillus simplex]MDF9763730.1 hypothetical protein [Peribacillus simplex]MDF9763745.1 hypothetical protein [Peribacillus simplex]